MHFGFLILPLISFTPLSCSIVLIVWDKLFLRPEDEQSTEKLKEVYHMAVWCVVRDVGVKHFSQEVIFDTKDSVEFVLD